KEIRRETYADDTYAERDVRGDETPRHRGRLAGGAVRLTRRLQRPILVVPGDAQVCKCSEGDGRETTENNHGRRQLGGAASGDGGGCWRRLRRTGLSRALEGCGDRQRL